MPWKNGVQATLVLGFGHWEWEKNVKNQKWEWDLRTAKWDLKKKMNWEMKHVKLMTARNDIDGYLKIT